MRLIDQRWITASDGSMSKRLLSLHAVHVTVEPASIGYHVCEQVEGLDGAGMRWWRPTKRSAIRKQAHVIGLRIIDGRYAPDLRGEAA